MRYRCDEASGDFCGIILAGCPHILLFMLRYNTGLAILIECEATGLTSPSENSEAEDYTWT